MANHVPVPVYSTFLTITGVQKPADKQNSPVLPGSRLPNQLRVLFVNVYGTVAAAWLEYPLSTLLVLTAVTT